MCSNSVLDFIKLFKSERMVHWEPLTEDEKWRISTSPMINTDLIKIVFSPEKYPKLVENIRKRMDDLEFLLQHPECCYDVYSYNSLQKRIWSTTRYTYKTGSFNSYYDDFFRKADKLDKTVPKGRNIRNVYNKIMSKLPERYREKNNSDDNFFGYFSLDSVNSRVQFESFFEHIVFDGEEQFYLIPYFIEYRNRYFLEWIYEYLSENEISKEEQEEKHKNFEAELERIEKDKKEETKPLVNIAYFAASTKNQVEEYSRKKIFELFEKHEYFVKPYVTEEKITYKAKNTTWDIQYEYKYSFETLENDLSVLDRILN